jgi:hypothetical protein
MQVGKCAQFDASKSQYASFSSTNLADLNGASFSFWFKHTGSETAPTGKIFSMRSAAGYEFSFGKADSNNFALFEIQASPTTSPQKIVVLSGFKTDEAVHYVVVFKRLPNPQVEVFKNGVAVEACLVTGPNFDNLACRLAVATDSYPNDVFTTNYVARSHASTPQYYSGFIDSFSIFPWVLSSAQITALSSATTSSMVKP